MSLYAFLKDKSLLLILHFSCMCILTGFLQVTGYRSSNIILILTVWLIILCCWAAAAYLNRKKYFLAAAQILENADQRYLLGELLPASFRLEDRLYQDMIRRSNKSVIEQLRRVEEDRRCYKEYIESWVHEIKAPITGISLVCENGRRTASSPEKEAFRTISIENQKIESHVDMVLYYARSEEVYKDYLIQETDLAAAAAEVLEKNRLILIQKHMQAQVSCTHTVFTDKKWITFILDQMVQNSAKYCCDAPVLKIYTECRNNGVVLILEDNGAGIPSQDLPRIFEKGFTGAGGRNHERATGMGLYLCRRLCQRLGIGISADSCYGKWTKMILEFPVSRFITGNEPLSFENVR